MTDEEEAQVVRGCVNGDSSLPLCRSPRAVKCHWNSITTACLKSFITSRRTVNALRFPLASNVGFESQ